MLLRSACAALLLLGHLSLGSACSPAATATATTTSSLQIGGMVCASCSQAITGALQRLEGVQAVTVDHVTGKATIEHDPARTSREALVAAVTALGYTVAAS